MKTHVKSFVKRLDIMGGRMGSRVFLCPDDKSASDGHEIDDEIGFHNHHGDLANIYFRDKGNEARKHLARPPGVEKHCFLAHFPAA